MLFLLDASMLITAHNAYYPVDSVPEYWAWLLHQAQAGRVKMPLEIYEEVKEGPTDGERDLLYAWMQRSDVKQALVLVHRDAVVTEVACEACGDEACRFEVRW